MSDSSFAVIDFDIFCVSCGYNLRGLHANGRCPECGAEITSSLDRAIEDYVRPIDSAWAVQIRDGAILSIVSFILIIALSLAPTSFFELRHPGRTVLLSLASGWWVLAWYAVLKVSRLEPTAPIRQARIAWALRLSSAVYSIFPFMSAVTPREIPRWGIIPLVLILVPTPVIAATLLYLRVRQLAARLGRRILAAAGMAAPN